MNLEELLEHTAKDYLDDRTDLLDGDPDELWPDTLLVRYFNEAQRILARRAWVIIETGVAPAGIVVLKTDQSLYDLHKSILRVFDATPTTQLSPLGRADDINLRNPYPPSSDAFDIGEAAAIAGTTLDTPGAALAIATDAGWRQMRVAPTPSSDQNGLQVVLKIARLPICWLDISDTKGVPEVPEDYHMWLCDYAAGRCLTQPNVDGQGKTDGRELLAEFKVHVSEARQDRQRANLGGDRWAFSSTTAAR